MKTASVKESQWLLLGVILLTIFAVVLALMIRSQFVIDLLSHEQGQSSVLCEGPSVQGRVADTSSTAVVSATSLRITGVDQHG